MRLIYMSRLIVLLLALSESLHARPVITGAANRCRDLEALAYRADPSAEIAESIGLVYGNDQEPGIARIPEGESFRYVTPNGRPITNRSVLNRIAKIGIPPSYVDVWISPDVDTHIQATAIDSAGRKQYRYHPLWLKRKADIKYQRMAYFGRALPIIRRQVTRELATTGPTVERVVAAVVRILDTSAIRIGNDVYAAENDTYGITTFERQHVRISGDSITFKFVGKADKDHKIEIEDPALVAVINDMRKLPGDRLFQFVDARGDVRPVTSSDVNAFLKQVTENDLTAKDFRTWSASVIALASLRALAPPETLRQGTKAINAAADAAADHLGNKRGEAKKSYIFPGVFTAYADGTLAQEFANGSAKRPRGLSVDEGALLHLLDFTRAD